MQQAKREHTMGYDDAISAYVRLYDSAFFYWYDGEALSKHSKYYEGCIQIWSASIALR